ncbi:MAG: efflux RND transporter periplasmic adaptor subunit [bacterium]|nr:efflux RND transporter periplasmic adaptor subunit [Candidatus Sumerlaeota bacterium]
MSRKWRLLNGAIIIIVIGIVIYWQIGGFQHKIKSAESAIPDSVIAAGGATAAEQLTIPLSEEAVGALQSRHRVDISPQIQAAILEVRFNAGDSVKQGDVLVRLDPRDLEARVGQAEQALSAAEANYKQASADYARAQELLNRKVASAQEADNARLRVEVTSASVGETRRGLEQARIGQSYAEIRSPVTGVVIEKQQNTGDVAMPGRAIISLYDPSLLRLEAPVREALARKLRPGDSLNVRMGSGELETTGAIGEIVPQADIASRSFLVKVIIPRVSGLYAGMYGRISITTGAETVTVVPANSVERIGQLEYVRIITNGKLEHRFVQTGRMFGDKLEILSGINKGEMIATASAKEARSGNQ